MVHWARIGIVVGVGLAVAFLLRAVLPADPGLTIHHGSVLTAYPLYRVAFWVCLVLTLIVAMFVARMAKSA